MAIDLSQSQKLTQTQTLNTQLIEALRLLTIPSQDLEKVIYEEAEKNPFLKVSETMGPREVSSYYIGSDQQKKSDDFDILLNMQTSKSEEDLYTHLKTQLGEIKLSDSQREISELIISSLDEKGLLRTDKDELLKKVHTLGKEDEFNTVLSLIQQLDPTGVAAPSVWDAMKIQAKELRDSNEIDDDTYNLALKLLEEKTFELLAKKEYSLLSKAYGVSKDAILNIVNVIKSLRPYPGINFGSNATAYVVPELAIKKNKNGALEVSLIDLGIPELVLDEEYTQMLKETTDKESEKFLKDNKKRAENLIAALDERKKTIVMLGNELLNIQREFFEKGPSFIAPLSLRTMSELIKRDESTISRIASSKYIDTDFGIFPIKTLFSREITGNVDGKAVSRDRAKAVLKQIIESSPKKLSDAKLAVMMQEKGFDISRRTIAKYRGEMGIEASQN